MTSITIASLISGPSFTVTIDPYGLNPLAEDYRHVNSATLREAIERITDWASGRQDRDRRSRVYP